ncbi:PilW family protein [Dyella acidisoli]|uniref:Pilus assembly protein PilW n=1 Tax=Dyella acidisoli TaxID=1867834 RepID=A0ABQ5XU24_9GAMM|nr:PilW family protein [Dyella acidisoli]GLQ94629.1 pilus assembly protein PilW [Dyella acidisoli]
MRYGTPSYRMAGFGLLELMIAMGLGLIVTAGLLVIFLAESQVYNNSSSQSLMQDADNAISATITPVARSAGFLGCGVLNANTLNNLGTAPSSLTFNTSSAVQGYTGTISSSFSFTDNAANVTATSDWSPALDSSIVNMGGAEQGSDIVVLLGATPNVYAAGLPGGVVGSPFAVNDTSELTGSGPWPVAVSDCKSSTIFLASSAGSGKLSYTAGPNGTPQYITGAQLVSLQQTMFYIGKDNGGQSTLYEAIMTIPSGGNLSGAAWTPTAMVPGVTAMKVLYGVGSNGQSTQYVDASLVSSWASVVSVKLGFLVEGEAGSAPLPSSAQSYPLLNSTIKVAPDTRMRHVFTMTINTRNTTLL